MTIDSTNGVDEEKVNMENETKDKDITKLNILEIKVNSQNEIYMIKSSDTSLIRKNKLLISDLIPYIATTSSTSPPYYKLFTDMKILLYNPELSNDELINFIRSPGKFSFMDEVIINKNVLNDNKNADYNDTVIDTVGPKKSFLVEELTVYVIQKQ